MIQDNGTTVSQIQNNEPYNFILMLTFKRKIKILKNQLLSKDTTYADSFKTDILLFFDDFSEDNQNLQFLNDLKSEFDIIQWIEKLTSKIVMKYDEEHDQLSDFIFNSTC